MNSTTTWGLLALTAIAAMPAAAQAPAQPAAPSPPQTTPPSPAAQAQPALQPAVETVILDGKGEKIGTLAIKGGERATVARITIQAGGLPSGWHGIHFHAVGDCSDAGKYEASKAHVNHGGAKHGLLNPEGPDEGDLPNLFVAADGSANAEVSTRTLLDGRNGLRDSDGSALIFHANQDDHISQPIGGAGARIACAVIK
jgi:Cu-Zn family superoxide dismutase